MDLSKSIENDEFSLLQLYGQGIAALLGVGVRCTVHYIAGVLFWGNKHPEGTSPWVYSLSVNRTAGLEHF